MLGTTGARASFRRSGGAVLRVRPAVPVAQCGWLVASGRPGAIHTPRSSGGSARVECVRRESQGECDSRPSEWTRDGHESRHTTCSEHHMCWTGLAGRGRRTSASQSRDPRARLRSQYPTVEYYTSVLRCVTRPTPNQRDARRPEAPWSHHGRPEAASSRPQLGSAPGPRAWASPLACELSGARAPSPRLPVRWWPAAAIS
jgi:hypothetical protein